jgi:hypothetical protein
MTDRGTPRDTRTPPPATARGADTQPPARPADRAQTVQDFAIGASVFLLTIAFVFAFIPTLFTPFDSNVAPGLDAQADRVGDAIVTDAAVDGKPNWLDRDETLDALELTSGSGTGDELQTAYGLPSTSQVNVTVTPMRLEEEDDPITDGGDTFAAGDQYRDRSAATVSRIVVIQGVDDCDPTLDADGNPSNGKQGKACRMTIRIW